MNPTCPPSTRSGELLARIAEILGMPLASFLEPDPTPPQSLASVAETPTAPPIPILHTNHGMPDTPWPYTYRVVRRSPDGADELVSEMIIEAPTTLQAVELARRAGPGASADGAIVAYLLDTSGHVVWSLRRFSASDDPPTGAR